LDDSQRNGAIDRALEALAGVGMGQVTVAGGGGVHTISFGGRLAGTDQPVLEVLPVQTLDLRLADGSPAETAVLRLGGQATAPLALAGLTSEGLTSTLQPALAGLLGSRPFRLEAVADGSGQVRLVDLAPAGSPPLPSLTLQLSRQPAGAPAVLRLGAAAVSGFLGTAQAGVALNNASLGLVITRAEATTANAAPRSGYALVAAGEVGLRGFGSAVSLQASGQLGMNTLGRPIDTTVRTGLTTPAQAVRFSDGQERLDLTIRNAQLAMEGLGTVQGDLAVSASSGQCRQPPPCAAAGGEPCPAGRRRSHPHGQPAAGANEPLGQ